VAKGFCPLKSARNFVFTLLIGMMFIRSGNSIGQANVMGFENLPKTNSGFDCDLVEIMNHEGCLQWRHQHQIVNEMQNCIFFPVLSFNLSDLF
jgi:hypothetical protein